MASTYDATADTIYVVTSGYSVVAQSEETQKRMRLILDRLDACLKAGVAVVRLQIEPDGPLVPEYIDRVCAQISGRGNLGQCRHYDVRDQTGLPSMAVVRMKGGGGFTIHTIDRSTKAPGGRSIRLASFAWSIHYDQAAIDALVDALDDFVRDLKPLSEVEFRDRFGTTQMSVGAQIG